MKELIREQLWVDVYLSKRNSGVMNHSLAVREADRVLKEFDERFANNKNQRNAIKTGA